MIINRLDNINEYNYIHLWVRRNYGPAKRCSICATKKAKRYEWALKKGCSYDRNIDNFIELCPSCHRKYDIKQEVIDKIINTFRANPNNHWGKYLPKLKGATGKKHPASKPIFSIDSSGNINNYESLTDANEKMGYKISTLSACLRGVLKTAYKLKWKYKISINE